MTMDKKRDRIARIIDILQERNGASIKQLAQEFGVNEMTIRRDLHVLQQNGLVNIIHGAAIFNPSALLDGGKPKYNIFSGESVRGDEKDRIGKEASKYVEPGDVLFVDIGTTAAAMVRHLGIGMNITVACFAMNTLEEIQKKKVEKLILGGGYYHMDTQAFECEETLQLIGGIRASKAFISPAGISMELGMTCVNKYEERMKQAFLHNSIQKILLADSSKFGKVRPCYFGDLTNIDMVITDKDIGSEWMEYFDKNNIKSIVV